MQIAAHTRQVLDGDRLAMFVFGGSGLGKNHIVERELHARGYGDILPITPASVNDLLREFHAATYRRRKAMPLVFDEARIIFETPANLNVMKLATDTAAGAKRYHSGFIFFEEHEVYDEASGNMKTKRVRQKGVSLAAPIIAMTNKNLNEFDNKTRDHAEALLSRIPAIEVPSGIEATWEYVVHLALTTNLLAHPKRSLSLAQRGAVIEWFTANLYNLKQVSVRTMLNARDAFAMPDLAFLREDLSSLLKPTIARVDRPAPRQLDWSALRVALS